MFGCHRKYAKHKDEMNKLYPLCSAIYYTRQGWSNLLKGCIGPLIQQMEKEGSRNDFALYFSEEQGEHIRLELYTKTMVTGKDAFLSGSIEKFLHAHPTIRREKPLPLRHSFFIDLPNNTVYTNCFKPIIPPTAGFSPVEVIQVRTAISALMLEAFAENEVDQASLFNFYLCLKMVSLSVFGNALDTAADALLGEFNSITSRLSTAEYSRIAYEADQLVKSNRDDLNDLLIVAEQAVLTSDTEWLAAWYHICRELGGTRDPLRLFNDISMFIRQHINFREAKWNVLCMAVINLMLSEKNNIIHYKLKKISV